jgi:hypothetical protein
LRKPSAIGLMLLAVTIDPLWSGCGTVGPVTAPEDLGVALKLDKEQREREQREFAEQAKQVPTAPQPGVKAEEGLSQPGASPSVPAEEEIVVPSARPSMDVPMRSR